MQLNFLEMIRSNSYKFVLMYVVKIQDLLIQEGKEKKRKDHDLVTNVR